MYPFLFTSQYVLVWVGVLDKISKYIEVSGYNVTKRGNVKEVWVLFLGSVL